MSFISTFLPYIFTYFYTNFDDEHIKNLNFLPELLVNIVLYVLFFAHFFSLLLMMIAKG